MKAIRNPKTKPASSPSSVLEVVRIGFAPSAKAEFDSLSPKARAGIIRKLEAYGANPSLGKPLVRALRSYDRVTYGRIRCIAKATDGILIVLHVGLRKSDAADDTYEMACAALATGDPEVVRVMQILTSKYVTGRLDD